MKANLLNKKGAALVWAVISLLIIVILVSASLSTATSYSNRSIKQTEDRQAYLTARSAMNAVLHNLDGYSVSGPVGVVYYNNALIPATIGLSVPLTGFDFPDEMGTVSGYVTRTAADKLNVSITAGFKNSSCTIKSVVKREITLIEGTKAGVNLRDFFCGLYTNQLHLSKNAFLTAVDNTDIHAKKVSKKAYYNATLTAGRDLYTDEKINKGKIKSIRVALSGTKYPFDNKPLPDNISLETPYILINDNTTTSIDLHTAQHDLMPHSYLLTKGTTALSAVGIEDVNGRIDDDVSIYVSGNDTYAIKVAAGCELNLDLHNNSLDSNTPNVFILLDSGSGGQAASLIISHVDYDINLFVYGGKGSGVTVSGFNMINGCITADEVNIQANLTLSYASPPTLSAFQGPDAEDDGEEGEGEGTEPTEDIEVHTWSFEKYED